jgi:hypothetical protein
MIANTFEKDWSVIDGLTQSELHSIAPSGDDEYYQYTITRAILHHVNLCDQLRHRPQHNLFAPGHANEATAMRPRQMAHSKCRTGDITMERVRTDAGRVCPFSSVDNERYEHKTVESSTIHRMYIFR